MRTDSRSKESKVIELPIEEGIALYLYAHRVKHGKRVPLKLRKRVNEIRERHGWSEEQFNEIVEILYERRDEWRVE